MSATFDSQRVFKREWIYMMTGCFAAMGVQVLKPIVTSCIKFKKHVMEFKACKDSLTPNLFRVHMSSISFWSCSCVLFWLLFDSLLDMSLSFLFLFCCCCCVVVVTTVTWFLGNGEWWTHFNMADYDHIIVLILSHFSMPNSYVRVRKGIQVRTSLT